MQILFLIFHGFEPNSGITKKIHYQVKGLRELGHDVHLCSYGFDEHGHRVRWVDDEVIADYGRGAMAILRSRLGLGDIAVWCERHGIDMVYARSFHNASPATIRLFRRLRRHGISVAMEIPTYPYDQEYVGFPWREQLKLHIDRLFRRRLAAATNAIVTFSSAQTIFGQRTIRISNGIDLEAISAKRQHTVPSDDTQSHDLSTGRCKALRTSHHAPLHFTAVAEVHYWHGLDRLIDGLGHYYSQPHDREIVFDIVGGVGPSEMQDSLHAPGFEPLIRKWGLGQHVVFHGQLFGDALTEVFDETDLCIGSLGRHRSGITDIKTLKNREYAARGIPFIYSEHDSDFDAQPYVMRVPADDSPIDIGAVLRFLESQTMTPAEIRATVTPLSWRNQMQAVVSALSGEARTHRTPLADAVPMSQGRASLPRVTYIVKYIAQLGGLDRVLTFKMNWLAAHGYDVSLITYEQRDHDFSFQPDPRISHTDIDVKLWKKHGSNILTRTLSYLRLRRIFSRRIREAVAATHPDVLVTLTDSYQVMDILMSIPTTARRIVESHVERNGFMKVGDFLPQQDASGSSPGRDLRQTLTSLKRRLLVAAARIYDRRMASYIARADALVCLTRHDAAQWPEVNNVRVVTNPLTVEPKALSDVSTHRAIAAGRLEDQKGFDLLIEAWQGVYARVPDWQLDIYGNGPDRECLQSQIDAAGLTQVVHLHAATPDIFARYAESSIYVLSSRYEGYGLVLAEAMSVGVPCVSFDCPYGPSDIIRDGEDGVLVPPMRTDLMADAIVRLATDMPLRQAMGQRARANIQRYAPASIMQQWQRLFDTSTDIADTRL